MAVVSVSTLPLGPGHVTVVSVTGVVRYAYGSYEVHPRDRFDINVEAP